MAILKWLDKNLEEFVLVVFLYLMVFASGAQIFMRYVVQMSLAWSEELTRYLFVWSGFFAIGYSFKRKSSLRIDAFVNLLPTKYQSILNVIIDVLSILLFATLIYISWRIMFSRATMRQVSPAMRLPMPILYAAPVVGFTIALIRLIQNLAQHSKKILRDANPDIIKEESSC